MATKKATPKEEQPEGLDFASVLKRLDKLAGSGGYPHLTLSPNKKGTYLSATAGGATVAILLKETIDGLDEALNFGFAALTGLTANRKVSTLKIKASTLHLDMGRLKSELVGIEASTVPTPNAIESPTCEFQINGEMRQLMADALPAVNLQKPLAALPDITVHLSFTKKTATLVSFDKSQMASYTTANTTGQVFELTLPLPRAEALFKGQIGDATVQYTEGYLYAKSGPFRLGIVLPPPTEASGVPIERVMERSTQLRSMDMKMHVDLNREDLNAFMENSKVLFKATAMLHLQVSKEGKSVVKVSSEGSSAKGIIRTKSKKDFEGWIDLSYVTALMSKCKGDSIGIALDDTIFIMHDEALVYSAVLSEPPSSESKKKSKAKSDDDGE